jgi:hypothetical protein
MVTTVTANCPGTTSDGVPCTNEHTGMVKERGSDHFETQCKDCLHRIRVETEDGVVVNRDVLD